MESGQRNTGYHAGAQPCRADQMSKINMATKAQDNTYRLISVGPSSESQATIDGATLAANLEVVSGEQLLEPAIQNPQWAPPRNESIIAPYAASAPRAFSIA